MLGGKKRQIWLVKKAGVEEVKSATMKQQGECRQGKDLLLLEQMEAFLLPKPKPYRSHGRSSYPEHKRSTCSIGFGEENSDFSATDRKAKGEKARAICPLTQLATALEYGGETPTGNRAERPSPQRRMAL